MSTHFKKNSRLVYSTETGCIRSDPAENKANIIAGDGVVRVCREKKGRSGKVVTVITGIPLTADKLKELAKALKKKCGVGGAVKSGNIEIQGDQLTLLAAELTRLGFSVKRSGG